MNNSEKQLSDYIDSLNAEKKPHQHEDPIGSAEMENLMETVRLVRSLKNPAIPGADYPEKLARAVAGGLPKKDVTGGSSKMALSKRPKSRWIVAMATVAAMVTLAIILNSILPFTSNNIVYAMEQAFQDVKAYHGILEVVESNAEGKDTVQAELEVWADKKGNYYVKELEGAQKGLITVNNGQKKWQLRPWEKEIYVFPAFPDPYRFTFELGKEIEGVRNALETKSIGEDIISGRKASILEVTPSGGISYRIWIDKETKLPLQKQSGMQGAIQYRITYKEIDFINDVPDELIAYNIPEDFKEVDTNPEQLVNSIEEAEEVVGFIPRLPESVPEGYLRDSIAVTAETETSRLYYTAQDKQRRVVVMQRKAVDELKPASTAVLGKVGDSIAEIQSPVEGNPGILTGDSAYSGATDISSIRWQQAGFEYAVVGNGSLEELAVFVKGLVGVELQIPPEGTEMPAQPMTEVPVDLEIEKNEQKSADAGHSVWRLDPAYVAQVFVSLKISPEGIQGEYPIKYEDVKILQNNGIEAIVEANGDQTPVSKVYLKKVVRQDSTGIWTVVGYDPS